MAKKILFITSNRLGDAVLSAGLLKHLIEQYPDSEITVACGPLAVSLFQGAPNVTDVFSLKKEKRAGHWIKLWQHCIFEFWDVIVDLRNSAVSRLLAAKKRYIYGPHISKDMHKVEQNAAVMKLDTPPSPRLFPTQEQLEKAQKYIPEGEPVIGVGPAANWIGKTWPAERFMDLIARITAKDGILPGARVAVFAAPGEEAQSIPVLGSVPTDKRIDMIAKDDPGSVAAAIARCSLYVGNDSGLMHCAAAVGIPTFGLFGPSYPQLYSPWGEHTAYARTPETFDELIDFEGYDPKTLDRSLMLSLETDDVHQQLVNFWQSLK